MAAVSTNRKSSRVDAEGQQLVGVKAVEGAQIWQAQEQLRKERVVVRTTAGH